VWKVHAYVKMIAGQPALVMPYVSHCSAEKGNEPNVKSNKIALNWPLCLNKPTWRHLILITIQIVIFTLNHHEHIYCLPFASKHPLLP
jgi:hypothetical protein